MGSILHNRSYHFHIYIISRRQKKPQKKYNPIYLMNTTTFRETLSISPAYILQRFANNNNTASLNIQINIIGAILRAYVLAYAEYTYIIIYNNICDVAKLNYQCDVERMIYSRSSEASRDGFVLVELFESPAFFRLLPLSSRLRSLMPLRRCEE
jgi:hypothetical protein